jgi:hypothetical protein
MVKNRLEGNKKWLIFLGFVFLLSCGRRDTPPGVLSREKMAQVLGEVHIAEEKVKRMNIGVDSSIIVVNELTQRVFDSLSVSDSVFKRSLAYYWDHPKEMDDVYASLVDSLNLREQKLSLPSKQP